MTDINDGSTVNAGPEMRDWFQYLN